MPAAAGLRAAPAPPERRGLSRDAVRLLVVGPEGERLLAFRQLPEVLRAGDLLVVNRSATLPAALDVEWQGRRSVLHLAQRYGRTLWLAEPRPSAATPGPLPLAPGDELHFAGGRVRVLGAYPGLPRLRFVRIDGAVAIDPYTLGRPIHYGHLAQLPPLADFQTLFGDRAGSAEMASAARPFTPGLVERLRAAGVGIARVTLHAGVSSQEVHPDEEAGPVPPEPFEVDAAAADAVNAALDERRRVIAVGTGATRALESAWDGRALRPTRGWTGKVLRPGSSGGFLAGILTGMHDPEATHLSLLRALVGASRVARANLRAREEELLGHEFGDLQLLWRGAD